MYKNKLKKTQRSYLVSKRVGLAIIVVLSTATAGHYYTSTSSAAYPHDPVGRVDSCALEAGATVLYGWAHDTDAPAGPDPTLIVSGNGSGVSKSVSTASDIAGYRDASVNAYLRLKFPGLPTSSIYGFKVSFGTIYTDQTVIVSGLIRNTGGGNNSVLDVNTVTNVDSDASKPYFINSRIPAACLSARPIAPIPAAPSAPVPSPAPVPAPRPIPKPISKPAPNLSTPPIILSAASDAVVAIGSLGASLKIPAGNATSIRVLYGTDPIIPNIASPDTAAQDGNATIELKNLLPRTQYTYQIVRTAPNGTETNAPVTSFTTAGIDIKISFVADTKPIKDIKSQLSGDPNTGTSDSRGEVSYIDKAPGKYNLSYTYLARKYIQKINVDAGATPKSIIDISTYTVKVNLATTAIPNSKQNGGSAIVPIVITGTVALVIVGLSLKYAKRIRRRKQQAKLPSDLDTSGYNEAPSFEHLPTNLQTASIQAEPLIVPLINSVNKVGNTATTNRYPWYPLKEQTAVATPTATSHNSSPKQNDAKSTLTTKPPSLPMIATVLPASGSTTAPKGPEHMGQSLRQMVIEAMIQETKLPSIQTTAETPTQTVAKMSAQTPFEAPNQPSTPNADRQLSGKNHPGNSEN